MSYERRKIRIGKVVSNKMTKTVVVSVDWRGQHKLYRKSIRRRSHFMAHDPEGKCRLGDTVKIIATRPISKLKRWRVTEVLAHEEMATEIRPEEIAVPEEVQAPKAVAPVAAEAAAEAPAEAEEKPKARRTRAEAEAAEQPAAEAKPKAPRKSRAKAEGDASGEGENAQ
ncbi:MAG: 30S ribosomal protein S17 [SAR202 cluster bacterium]|nr:30S ribosomal protein S17 [SAR202 cluster bacterium]